MVHDPYAQGSEVDLRELVGTLIKRKKTVLSVCFVSVLLTAAWNLMAPSVYNVSMLIEPPIIALMDGGVQNFDSTVNIKAKIESAAYNHTIIEELGLTEKVLPFSVSLTKDTKLIAVGLTGTSDKVDANRKILGKLLDLLNRDYAEAIAAKRDRIENQIKMVLLQIGTKESQIKLNAERFKLLADRERQLLEEIKGVRANSERLIASRNALLEQKENKDAVSSLLYSVTIQQDMSYFTELQNSLSTLRNNKENILNEQDNLRKSIDGLRIEIGNINVSKDFVQNIHVVQKPQVSALPIGPKRTQNVMIAAVVSLIVGVLAALFFEYYNNSPTTR